MERPPALSWSEPVEKIAISVPAYLPWRVVHRSILNWSATQPMSVLASREAQTCSYSRRHSACAVKGVNRASPPHLRKVNEWSMMLLDESQMPCCEDGKHHVAIYDRARDWVGRQCQKRDRR